MIIRKSQRNYSSQPFWNITPDTSPQISPVASHCDADDEATMSAEEFVPSRPLSVAIPLAHSFGGRPSLADVLANNAPPPWTLSAFMAYLSQNHCLENLEFYMDVKRYKEAYDVVATQMAGMPMSGDSDECEELREQWQRLLDAYLVPGALREVNLPAHERDELLSQENSVSPPLPETLDGAEKRIYDLMEESIFFSFVGSVSSTSQSYNPPYHRDSDEFPSVAKASLDDRGMNRSRSGRHRSPSSGMMDFSHSTLSPGRSTHGRPHSSSLTSGLSRSNHKLSTQASHQSDSGLTDDSGSASSPGREPMTPPTTPPSSDMGNSPKYRNDNTWKKMGQKLGWKKKSSGGLRPMEEEP
jgi:hypothetical protein